MDLYANVLLVIAGKLVVWLTVNLIHARMVVCALTRQVNHVVSVLKIGVEHSVRTVPCMLAVTAQWYEEMRIELFALDVLKDSLYRMDSVVSILRYTILACILELMPITPHGYFKVHLRGGPIANLLSNMQT